MRRFFLILVTGSILLPAGSLRAAEQVYRIGIYQNPPLVFLDEAGNPSGFFPELLAAASRNRDWSLDYIFCNWSECLQQLEQGRLDLLAPIAFTPPRSRAYDFLETTVLSNWGQIYIPPQSKVSSILDLDDKRVATVADDVYLEGPGGLRELAHNFDLTISFVQVENYDRALHAVSEGRADVALVNRIFGAWHREKFDLVASSVLINPVDIRIAFARGQGGALRAELDTVLGGWKEKDGSIYHRLLMKWLSPERQQNFLPLWFVPLLTALVTSLMAMWLIILLTRRQVRLQTRRVKAKNRLLEKELQARYRIEDELKERQQQYRVLFEENQSVMLLVDPETEQIVDANPAASRFYGYPPDVLKGLPVSRINTAPPEEIRARFAEVHDGAEHKFEFVHRQADGSLRDVEVYCGPMVVGGRKLLCSVIHDTSERRRFQDELTEKHRFLQTVIDGVADPITVIATDFKVLMMNRVAAETLSGRSYDRNNFCCYELLHQLDRPCQGGDHPCPLEEVRQTGETVTMIHHHKRGKDDRIYELTASPLWNTDGSLRGIIEASRDITDRLKVEELLSENEKRLQHLAHHDPLTDLPNRLLFEDRLRHALAQAQRRGRKMALMFIDLDRFKNINDTLGHEVGDHLLVEVARRLRASVREGDTVARLGGDEFLVLLEEVDGFQAVATMAQRIRSALRRSAEIDSYQLVATGSIGISIYPGDADTAEELLKCADVAMYHAKEEGKDNYQFYTPRLNARAHEMLLLERDLRQALEDEQLCLFYQPQVELKTGRLIGVEALVRWHHPQQGLVPPDDFIPLAEETGLIAPIGEWVLREACRQQVAWQQQDFPELRMAVNISGRQLKQPDFVETVDLILTETGIDPSDLELEITESIIMRDVKSTIMILTDLRMRGIRLAIDDFGTGYSSLSYLNRFPVDQLKIDHSFVFRLGDDKEPVVIVDAVIALGRSMNLEVIAEGIESQQQMEILAARGCHLGQGYLFSRPIPGPELREKFLTGISSVRRDEPRGFRFNFPEQDA